MLYTFTFTSISARNTFVNIVKELWFSVDINTYSEIKSSKSEVKEHILWGGRDVKTENNTITRYEINIEKNMNEKEINYFNDFIYYYFNKEKPENNDWIVEWVSAWLWITLIIRWLLALIFKFIKIPYLIDIYSISIYKFSILLFIFIFLSIKFSKSWKPKSINKANKIEEKNNKIKKILLNEYLWEYWKKIISNM